MSVPVFYKPINRAKAFLASPHVIGDGVLVVDDGSIFGTPSSSHPVKVTTTVAGADVHFSITNRSTNTLTIGAVVDGSTDTAVPSGAAVDVRIGAKDLQDVHDAILSLYADPNIIVPLILPGDSTSNFEEWRSGSNLLGFIDKYGNVCVGSSAWNATDPGASAGGLSIYQTDAMVWITSNATSGNHSSTLYLTEGLPMFGTYGGLTRYNSSSSIHYPSSLIVENLGHSIILSTGRVSTEYRADFQIDSSGNVMFGSAALSTSATNGFPYFPSCPGVPSGTPTTHTGLSPVVFNSVDKQFYVYDGTSWISPTTFRGISSTSTVRTVGSVDAGFVVSTDASYTGYIRLMANDFNGSLREGIRVASDGTQAITTLTGQVKFAGNTATRIPYFGTAGLLTDSANIIYDGTSIITHVSDSGTTSTPVGLTISHATSGTPATGFGVTHLFTSQSTTTADQNVGRIVAKWVTATHASRTGQIDIAADDYTGTSRVGVSVKSDGTQALVTLSGITTIPTAKIQAHYGDWTTATDASTVNLDMSVTDKYILTATSGVGSSRTLTFSNFTVGQVLMFEFIQAASGGPYSLTWPTIRWANGLNPTTSTTASKADMFVVTKRSDGTYVGAISIPNY